MDTYHPVNNPKTKAELKREYYKVYWSLFNPFAWYDFLFNCQHDFDDTTEVKKETYEDHKHTDKIHIYTVTTRKCKCGEIVYDSGLEMSKDLSDKQIANWILNG